MRIHIVSNIDNGKGLEREYRLLRGLLENWGHQVSGVHFHRAGGVAPADLAIFLEVYEPAFERLAPRRWLFPHLEWWPPEKSALLDQFEWVLCKTHDALARFRALTERAIWTGFFSEDREDKGVGRARRFLHIQGGSVMKGTDAVVEAWRRFKIRHPLSIVSSLAGRLRVPGIEVFGRLEDRQLHFLQNAALFHLCPSEYEGWGHTVHEALSVGAAVAATEGPPLSEVAGVAVHIPAVSFGHAGLATTAQVSAEGVRDAVEKCASFTDAELRRIAASSREAFLEDREGFMARLWSLLDGAAPRRGRSKRVAPTRQPRVAIVFPTHAAGASLVRRSVLALRAQTAAPDSFEVVVACDGGDPGGDIRRAVDPQSHPFRVSVVDSPRPNGAVPHRNHARNAGWKSATAPVCFLLDSDFLLPPHAVEHLLREHDEALERGLPATFSPVLSSIDLAPEDWLAQSNDWASSGQPEALRGLLDRIPIRGGVFSGYEDHYRPGPPASERLVDQLEGMPVVWRGLLEALGGLDEWFVGWGAEKEAFVDLLKGLARARLIDVRLLTSVRALHQPHPPDPEALRPQVRGRQDERERRAREIRAGAPWWRETYQKAFNQLEAAIVAAGPSSILSGRFAAETLLERALFVAQACATVAPLVRGLHGGVVVAGDAAAVIAERLTLACGLATRVVPSADLKSLPARYACAVVVASAEQPSSIKARVELCGEALRVAKGAAPVVMIETLAVGSDGDEVMEALRRRLPNAKVSSQRRTAGRRQVVISGFVS